MVEASLLEIRFSKIDPISSLIDTTSVVYYATNVGQYATGVYHNCSILHHIWGPFTTSTYVVQYTTNMYLEIHTLKQVGMYRNKIPISLYKEKETYLLGGWGKIIKVPFNFHFFNVQMMKVYHQVSKTLKINLKTKFFQKCPQFDNGGRWENKIKKIWCPKQWLVIQMFWDAVFLVLLSKQVSEHA